MNFGTAMIIFFLAIIALVAEIILYFVFGIGAAFTGDISTLGGTALFFVCLMIITAAIGILSPLCALLEMAVKKKNIGIYTMLTCLSVLIIGLFTFSSIGMKSIREIEKDHNKISISEISEQNNVSNGVKTDDQNDLEVVDIEKSEKEQYIKNIIVRNIKIGQSILDEKGVWGEIKNTGDKTLKSVEITIYCLDKNGMPIFEKTYHPVSEFSFFDDDGPLKPNYSRKFGVKLDDAPSDWAQKVEIKVSDLEFSE